MGASGSGGRGMEKWGRVGERGDGEGWEKRRGGICGEKI